MFTRGAHQRVQTLPATTFLITTMGFISPAATAQERSAQGAPVRNANAQAVTLDPINVRGDSNGTVGNMSVATKVNTPSINIPQSLSIVTKEFIKDQSFQSVTNLTRYVPGVAVRQGEGKMCCGPQNCGLPTYPGTL